MQPAHAGADRDPVCGMRVDPAAAAASVTHEGRRYHFCAPGCAEKFRADPLRYLAPTPPPPPAAADAIYTCPMHPAVRQRGPGHCPICGMALEPLVATEPADDAELRDLTRRF